MWFPSVLICMKTVKVLSDITKLLYQYVQEGNASEYLQSLNGVAVGFADGDLNILFENPDK